MLKNKTLIIIILAGLIIRLVFMLVGVFDTLASDDAFYYFTIAKHAAAGQGATFDGLSKTNGFHPLWLLILIPVYKFLGQNPWPPLYLTFVIVILLDLASAVLIYKITEKIRSKRAGLIASAFWLFSPLSLFISAQAMEASLATTITLTAIYFAFRIYQNPSAYRLALALGVFLGLMILARTDLILIYALIFIFLFYLYFKIKYPLKKILLAIFLSLAIISPWLIWNLINFHSIFQVSALSKIEIAEKGQISLAGYLPTGFQKDMGFLSLPIYLHEADKIVSRGILGGGTQPRFTYQYDLIALVIFVIFALVIIERIRSFFIKNRGSTPEKIYLLIAFTFIAAQYFIYAYLIKSYWPWYALLPFALFSVLAGGSFERIIFNTKFHKKLKGAAILSIFLLITAAITYVNFRILPIEKHWKEKHFADRLDWINQNVPAGSNLGVFNAGEYGYFASYQTRSRVINLDLLVNNKGYDALKKGGYDDYVVKNIDYLAEYQDYFYYFFNTAQIDALMKNFREIPNQTGFYFYENITKDK